MALSVAGPVYPSEYYRAWRSTCASEDTPLPRIPELLMDGAVFLFRTRAEAEARAKLGGTAFVVGKPLLAARELAKTELQIPYLVSCRHVVYASAASVVCINRRDGSAPDIFETDPTEWIAHPGGDDVAVTCAASYLSQMHHKVSHIQVGALLREKEVKLLQIGPGEEVFMIGRFLNHQGQTQNKSAARFGSISMMQEKIWVKEDHRYQDSFAVEMRSRTGFSGSAVAVYRTPATSLVDVNPTDFWKLLGVNWGYIRDDDGENTWLNGVVPAWKILEILEVPALKKQHEEHEQKFRDYIKSVGRGDATQAAAGAATAPLANDENPTHREDFMSLVNAAARKPAPKD